VATKASTLYKEKINMTTNSNAPVVRTELIITSSDTDYQIPGDMSASQLQTVYASQIPGLSNMVHETTVAYREALGGNVRTVTFKPKTGTKGAERAGVPVVRTELIITSSDTDYQIPGDMSASQLQTVYASQIPGLSNMVFETTVDYREALGGNVRTVTFKPKTGTKG
jgi:hypothetical protein